MAGRPPTYQSTAERPVSLSVRVPRDLYTQVQERVHRQRLTLSAALLDGLQLWLQTSADPRELFLSDESNTVMHQLQELVTAAVQGELAKLLSAPLAPQTTPNTPDSGNTVLREIQHADGSRPHPPRASSRVPSSLGPRLSASARRTLSRDASQSCTALGWLAPLPLLTLATDSPS